VVVFFSISFKLQYLIIKKSKLMGATSNEHIEKTISISRMVYCTKKKQNKKNVLNKLNFLFKFQIEF